MTDRRRTKGEGSIFQRADGTWVGRVDFGWIGGKRVRREVRAKTKRELTPKFRALQRQAEQGVITDGGTVEAWLEHWYEKIAPERCRQRTLDGYRTYLDRYLIKHLGRRRLASLKPEHVRDMLAAMESDGLSDATRRQAHMILLRALKVAQREGKTAINAADLVDRPPVPKNHRTPLTVAQAKQILRSLDGDPLAARWVAALLLGMRQGECLGLRWEDVDFDNGRIYVRNELIRLRGKGLVLTPPKSDTSMRLIPFGAVPPAVLAFSRTEHRGEFVFYGERMDPRRDWQEWKDLLVRSGVCSSKMKAGDMPELHAARATTASLLDEAKVSDKVIAEILGHSSVQITRASYIFGNEDRHRAALGSLADLLKEDSP